MKNSKYKKMFESDDVMEFLGATDKERTAREIREALGCSRPTLDKLLVALIADGDVQQRNIGTEKKAMWLYSIKKE